MIILFFIIGLALVIKGADWFTDASVSIAKIARIPEMVIGATLVSIATSLPEFSVSVISASKAHTGMALGNAVGSCTANIGLILGIVWVFGGRTIFHKQYVPKNIFMLGSGFILFGFAFLGRLNWSGGVLFICILVFYLYYNLKLTQRYREAEFRGETEKIASKRGSLLKTIIFFVIGGAAIIGGSYLLVDSGVKIARALGVSETIIGLSMVAFGTSLPELMTSVVAVIKGYGELSIGNIIGSNIFNITGVLGVASVVRTIPITSQNKFYDLPIMLLLMIMVTLWARRGKGHVKGAAFLAIYAGYIAYLFLR
jgi:cation:H+ antiporter